ncbi:patatin-like phospholipase family protein [Clostridium fallax]|uniref:NTE family protein n=1 Tax=Clostridium fallax TaxID=1533 RepID=A0A1M4ZE21_9CLOT|nr:patatin-like phospholipase family protein [Clostridium fallax]SHF16032.1 NTE family protein [Clostridium fallax]SQB22221.1 phospholipase, patatin family [Clostridium fallax]
MKLGLVLAGGGGRGAYQIGVWEALKELGVDKYIEGVSGTSIGALNAILFLQGDIDIAKEAWMDISVEKILPTDNLDLMTRGVLLAIGSKKLNFVKKYMPRTLEKGNISRKGLIDILDKYIDFNTIINNNKSFYVACSELPQIRPRYFKLNNKSEDEIRNILLATSAIPIIYESEKVNEYKYLDGGITDNIPIQPLYGEGYDPIIVVHLCKNSFIERDCFPNSEIIEIKPKYMDDSVSETLDFTKEGARRRFDQGYNDCINLFHPIMNIARYQMQKAPMEAINNLGKKIKEKSFRFRNIFKR